MQPLTSKEFVRLARANTQYPLVFLFATRGPLCHACAEARLPIEAPEVKQGLKVWADIAANYDCDELFCEHCGKDISE